MSKILISFIGTGPTTGDRATRKYRPAKYKIGGRESETEFVAKALNEFVNPDKMFLIGTPHSMWEKVYESFSDQVDDDIWLEIDEWSNNANSVSKAEGMPHQSELERAIGKDSKIFLIRYGINDEQIQENINIILGIRCVASCTERVVKDLGDGNKVSHFRFVRFREY